MLSLRRRDLPSRLPVQGNRHLRVAFFCRPLGAAVGCAIAPGPEELDALQVDLQPEERDAAADLVRALFSLGTSPVEAKAVLTEVVSPPLGDSSRGHGHWMSL